MRKLIFGINLTLDGCCDHTKGIGNDDVHEYFADLLMTADTLLYGRKTYELMVPFWPDMARQNDAPTAAVAKFARAFNNIESRIVCSRTMEEKARDRTAIIRDNLREEVLRLKQQPGGNISTGGVDVPSQLIAMGLVDEFHFVIQPILAGAGRRFMDTTQLIAGQQLQLVNAKVFDSGFVALHFCK